jgi:hypothetical protein
MMWQSEHTGTEPAPGSPTLAVVLCLLFAVNLACEVSGKEGPIAPGPEVSLSANPTVVPAGGTTTLTWVVTDAIECVASNGWAGLKGAGGENEDVTVNNDSTYTLTCTDTAGNDGSDSASVKIEGGSNWDAAVWAEDVWN